MTNDEAAASASADPAARARASPEEVDLTGGDAPDHGEAGAGAPRAPPTGRRADGLPDDWIGDPPPVDPHQAATDASLPTDPDAWASLEHKLTGPKDYIFETRLKAAEARALPRDARRVARRKLRPSPSPLSPPQGAARRGQRALQARRARARDGVLRARAVARRRFERRRRARSGTTLRPPSFSLSGTSTSRRCT